MFGLELNEVDQVILTSTKKGKKLRDLVAETTGRKFKPNEIVERAQKLELDLIANKGKKANMKITEGWTGTNGVLETLSPN